jgi:hypothetical protein
MQFEVLVATVATPKVIFLTVHTTNVVVVPLLSNTNAPSAASSLDSAPIENAIAMANTQHIPMPSVPRISTPCCND